MRKPLNLSLHQSSAWRGWALGGKPGLRGTSSDFSFSYAYDACGRPVSRSGDAFAYDARGEVTNAVLDGAAYRYAYDHIGNRTSATEAGATTSYAANNVNQYAAVGAVEPEYDDDGNLTALGGRAYEWTADGRLFIVSDDSARTLQDYDWRGRRTTRFTERFNGRVFDISEDRDYVYDGWNLVYEHRDHTSEGEAELSYFWGPDLSGSLQGAGGVGGLVAVSVDGDYYFPGYDNNGNVIGYWHEEGDLVAEYAYDAFGNTIYEDGDMADFFPHRFSTKYYDADTDLYYYGYRYYSPGLGRWISRDPIEEDGGNNLYNWCNNGGLFFVDAIGEEISHSLQEDGFGGWTLTLDIPIQVVDCAPDANESRPRKTDMEIQKEINKTWKKEFLYEKDRIAHPQRGVEYIDTKNPIVFGYALVVNSTVTTVESKNRDPTIHTFYLTKTVSHSSPQKRYVSHATIGGLEAWIYRDRRDSLDVYVHEFGHWLGLGDLYDEYRDETRGNNLRTKPKDGFKDNIMADSSKRGITLWQIEHIRNYVENGIVSPGPPPEGTPQKP